jgi:hypothetical protein
MAADASHAVMDTREQFKALRKRNMKLAVVAPEQVKELDENTLH